jgi:hypothetical protein
MMGYELEDESKNNHPTHDELIAAAMPLLKLLNDHFDPMCYALVTEGQVQILRGEIGAPLPIRD